jgi:ketosteroid isomerase-like protein
MQVVDQEAHMGSAASVANQYLTAFYSGDVDGARQTVAENFSFNGPFVQASSRDGFFQSAAPLSKIVRGHRLLRQWEDGEDVCSVYRLKLETSAGSGDVLMTEWHTIRHGKLASSRVIFDTAAFRALVPGR